MAEASAARPRASLRMGRLLGIAVDVHWSFGLLLVLVVAAEASLGAAAVLAGLTWVLAIFASVLLHELGHCVVARRRGVVIDDILLIPIGGISRMRQLTSAPRSELAIALAGPLTSVALALALGLLAVLLGEALLPPTLLARSWPVRLAWANLLLGAFNLLPALPMDGGRVLRAALSLREGRRRATRHAARVARVLAVAMIAAGIAYDPWLVLIGAFVLLAAGAEEAQVGDGGRSSEPGAG